MIRKQRARVAPRPGETRRSGFKSLRPHPRSPGGSLLRGIRTAVGRRLCSPEHWQVTWLQLLLDGEFLNALVSVIGHVEFSSLVRGDAVRLA